MTSNPQITMKIAQPVSPWSNSQKAAPPQISGGPTGIIERKKVAPPSSIAAGTPAIRKPMIATTACAAAVPTMPIITPLTVFWVRVRSCSPNSPPSLRLSTRSRAAIRSPSR